MENRKKLALAASGLVGLLGFSYFMSPKIEEPALVGDRAIEQTLRQPVFEPSPKDIAKYKIGGMQNNEAEEQIKRVDSAAAKCVDDIAAYEGILGEYVELRDAFDALLNSSEKRSSDFCFDKVLGYEEEGGEYKERGCSHDITKYLEQGRKFDDHFPIPGRLIREFCRGRNSLEHDALVFAKDIYAWHKTPGDDAPSEDAEYTDERGVHYLVRSSVDRNAIFDGGDFLDLSVTYPAGDERSYLSIQITPDGIVGREVRNEVSIDLSSGAAEAEYRAAADEFGKALHQGLTNVVKD